MSAMSEVARRFPFADYPKGWFQVAYSRDVADGSVASLHYFGRKLICYRGESGTVYVLDAHCPHLGADIAVGGTVREDCVVRPETGEKTRIGMGFAQDFCKQIEQDIPHLGSQDLP